MKKAIALLVIFSFSFTAAAQAGMVQEPKPVEDELISADRYSYDSKGAEKAEEDSGGGLWKALLGVALVGGLVAAAAAGGGGSGDSGDGKTVTQSGNGETGSVSGSW